MYEIWDSLNLIGIVIQIIGFVLLLPRFISWFKNRIENIDQLTISLLSDSFIGMRFNLHEKGTMPTNQRPIKIGFRIFPPRIDIDYNSELELKKSLEGFREGLGISFIILGLCFHFAAIVLEKGNV